jgi:hypothetical protein
MVGELCSWRVTPLLQYCEHARDLLSCLPHGDYLTRPPVNSGKGKKPGFPVTGSHSQRRDVRFRIAGGGVVWGGIPFDTLVIPAKAGIQWEVRLISAEQF